MVYKNNPVSIETMHHVIEVSDGCLSIDEKRFPDDCVSLDPAETEGVLRLLLAHRYGGRIVEESEMESGDL